MNLAKTEQQSTDDTLDKNKEDTTVIHETQIKENFPFERSKHRLYPTENLKKTIDGTEDFSITDNVDHQKVRRKYASDEYIKLVKVGRSRTVKVNRINSEILEVKEDFGDDKTVTKQYFQHVPPIRDYDIDAGEKIMHFAYEDEPFTRDWFTMRPVDDQKKWNKLLEIGCVVRDNDLQNLIRFFSIIDEQSQEVLFGEKEIREQLFNKSPTGYFFKPEWAGFDMYGMPRKVYDISDLDAIKEEMYKVSETELIKGYAESVMVDPYAKANKGMEFLIIVFCMTIILLAAVIVIWT